MEFLDDIGERDEEEDDGAGATPPPILEVCVFEKRRPRGPVPRPEAKFQEIPEFGFETVANAAFLLSS